MAAGITISLTDLQQLKAPCPISETDSGILLILIELHSKKDKSPIVRNVSGK